MTLDYEAFFILGPTRHVYTVCVQDPIPDLRLAPTRPPGSCPSVRSAAVRGSVHLLYVYMPATTYVCLFLLPPLAPQKLLGGGRTAAQEGSTHHRVDLFKRLTLGLRHTELEED